VRCTTCIFHHGRVRLRYSLQVIASDLRVFLGRIIHLAKCSSTLAIDLGYFNVVRCHCALDWYRSEAGHLMYMVNGKRIKWIAFILRFYPERLTILRHTQPFIHQRWCQPCKVTSNTSGAVRVRWCLAQGHLEPATLPLPDNLSYLLSYCRHPLLSNSAIFLRLLMLFIIYFWVETDTFIPYPSTSSVDVLFFVNISLHSLYH